MKYLTHSIIGITLSSLLFAGCSEQDPLVDGPETAPQEVYYIENNSSADVSISGFKGICFYNYNIPLGSKMKTELVDADSAWVFVGESIVNKIYLKDNQERNFLRPENYSVLNVGNDSISYLFSIEDSDVK